MPSLLLPFFPDQPRQFYDIALDGVEYRLDIRYVDRASSWYMDLRLPDGTGVIVGQRLATDWPVNSIITDETPAGVIVPVTTLPVPAPTRLRDLGDTTFLWYQSPDDVPEIDDEPAPYITITAAVP